MQRVERAVRQLIVPTLGQAVISLISSAIVLILFHHDIITSRIAAGANTPVDYVNTSSERLLRSLGSLPYAENIAVWLFWIALGVSVYFLTLLSARAMTDIRNDLLMQRAYTNKKSDARRWSRPVAQLLLLAVLVILALVTVESGLPLWSWLFGQLFAQQGILAQLSQAAVGWVGLAANIYILWMLVMAIFSIDPLSP
jgi:hypothetical protein